MQNYFQLKFDCTYGKQKSRSNMTRNFACIVHVLQCLVCCYLYHLKIQISVGFKYSRVLEKGRAMQEVNNLY